VESRLIPVNAFIALASPPATTWPSALYDVGFRVEGLEIPIGAGGGRIVIDCVAFDPATNRFLSAEAKSGSNVEVEQAQRYGEADPRDLVRIIGVSIKNPGELAAETVYVCLAESVDRIVLGLEKGGCQYPVLEVGADSVELHRRQFASDKVSEAFAEPVAVDGPPPEIISVDDHSPDEEFDRLVSPALVAEVSQGANTVGCPDLAARAIPHLRLFGQGHRNALIDAVSRAAQRLCDAAPENFEYRGRTQERGYGVVKIVDNPEHADPRGRTQRYQALKRRLGGVVPAEPGPEQGSLFDEIDLAAELDKADTGEPETDDAEEEER